MKKLSDYPRTAREVLGDWRERGGEAWRELREAAGRRVARSARREIDELRAEVSSLRVQLVQCLIMMEIDGVFKDMPPFPPETAS